MFKAVQTLKLLKYELKHMGNQHTKSILDEAKEYREALKLEQLMLQTNPLDIANQQEEKNLNRKYKESSYLSEIHLQQQGKVT